MKPGLDIKAVKGRLIFLRGDVEIMSITPGTVIIQGKLNMETREFTSDGTTLTTLLGAKMGDWEWLEHGLALWAQSPAEKPAEPIVSPLEDFSDIMSFDGPPHEIGDKV